MLGNMDDDDVASIKSSPCGSGSDTRRSGPVKPKEAGPSKEIGEPGVTLPGDCSQVSAKRRVVVN